jgi:hypothetical protein
LGIYYWIPVLIPVFVKTLKNSTLYQSIILYQKPIDLHLNVDI